MRNTHITGQLRELHGSVLDLVGLINSPHRDETIIAAAGIRLDRALFPLLVLVERLGPIGVVQLADRVGRDYTTVSRQLDKLDALGLVTRASSAADRRVRQASIAPAGKAMTDRIDAARDRLLREGFADWEPRDIDALVTLMRRLVDGMWAAQDSRDGGSESP